VVRFGPHGFKQVAAKLLAFFEVVPVPRAIRIDGRPKKLPGSPHKPLKKK
jgi:hypothetical protein